MRMFPTLADGSPDLGQYWKSLPIVGTKGYTCWWKPAFPFIIIITIYGVQYASQALYKHYCRSLKSNYKVNIGASQVVLVVKNLSASAGDVRDMGSTPGSGRSPGEGNGNPLQYSCLGEIPWTEEPGRATVHGVAESDRTEHQHISHFIFTLSERTPTDFSTW